MLKRILSIFILFAFLFLFASADDAPRVNCIGLPGCVDTVLDSPTAANVSQNMPLQFVTSIISQLIQFVAIIAIIALIISGILYLISGWEEEKVKRAKTRIIWSLVWVVLSLSAWGIINMLNKITVW